MKYRLKHIVEYGAVRGVCGLIRVLPESAAFAVGAGLARLAHLLGRSRVATAHARIREVLGDELPRREVRRIAWISLRNTFFNAIEMMRLRGLTPDTIRERVTHVDSIEPLRAGLREDRGAIIVVPHLGNWDLAAVMTHMLGLPIFFIVGHQKNPLTNDFLIQLRSATGMESISKHDSPLRKAVRRLRKGQVLAFMTDLRSKTPGVRVQFMGKEANLVGGMGLLARQAGVPVYPAVVVREGWFRHRWDVSDPVWPDPSVPGEEDMRRMTQDVMHIYERAIRAQPDQYFWYNSRWVLEPLAVEPCVTRPCPAPSLSVDAARRTAA